MFDSDFNIICGDRMVGKTTWLLNLSEKLTNLGLKVYFISPIIIDDILIKNKVTFYRFLKLDDRIDMVIDSIKESIIRDNYDYLIIDDLDLFTNKVQSNLSKIQVKKISIYNGNFMVRKNLIDKFHLYKIKNGEIVGYNTNSFIRDQKLNSLLNGTNQ